MALLLFALAFVTAGALILVSTRLLGAQANSTPVLENTPVPGATGPSDFPTSARPGTVGQPTIEFTTENGKGSQEGALNSPLRVTVQMIGSLSQDVSGLSINVSLQLIDDAGKPAIYGGQAAEPFVMSPSFEAGSWSYYGSVPGRAGTYRARLVVNLQRKSMDTPAPDANQTYIFDLTGTSLKAIADSGPPLVSGYVFSQNSDIWLMSTDLKRQRRLTFDTPPDEFASAPAWSPDGRLIAYTFSPKTDLTQLPATDIWVVKPDGSGAHEMVKHVDNEELKDPAWSSDGRYLYYTANQSDPNSSTLGPNGVPVSGVRIDRLDTQTGVRITWIQSGEMAAEGGSPNRMLYLEDLFDNTTSPSGLGTGGQQMVSVNVDGSNKTVVVDRKTYIGLDYPTMSPDAKWIAFAAIYLPRSGSHDGFDLFSWLGVEPQAAAAHGLPWDLFMVSSQGGTPVKLNKLTDDQPRPAWLDNTALTYMGSYGMYKLQIDSTGKPLQDPKEVHAGAPHGGLSWHGP